MKALMSLTEAAAETPYGVDTMRRAVRATDPSKFPHPLAAKRDSKGRIAIRAVDLQAWIDGLDDA